MLILLFLLKKLLFKPVMKILNQREAEVKKLYDSAAMANEKAEGLEKEYSDKMSKARDEAGEIIKQATLSARRREEEILDEAQVKAVSLTKKAQAEIAQERKKAYQEIKEEISDISVSIASKMVKREINAADHRLSSLNLSRMWVRPNE